MKCTLFHIQGAARYSFRFWNVASREHLRRFCQRQEKRLLLPFYWLSIPIETPKLLIASSERAAKTMEVYGRTKRTLMKNSQIWFWRSNFRDDDLPARYCPGGSLKLYTTRSSISRGMALVWPFSVGSCRGPCVSVRTGPTGVSQGDDSAWDQCHTPRHVRRGHVEP